MLNGLRNVLRRTETVSFDCYGTLVDWEAGLRAALVEMCGPLDAERLAELFETYLGAEASIEGKGYRPYREVIAKAVQRVTESLMPGQGPGRLPDVTAIVERWTPFPDTCDALARLKKRYRLGVLSNVDPDLFALTARQIPVEFDFVVTAEDVRAYKPAHLHFHRLLNVHAKRESVLHVAQSLFHDGLPARQMGLPFVWINRRHQDNETDVEPLAEFPDLASFADATDEAFQ
ncbi:MAG TPA: HAD-IA family hydrolase [Phycisphaerae bacterium]|nr:HAD-IA family hydrolase [Phycisphaerae bacterium]HNU46816.1 HAD-IA family hydrolase [Phycisphaerae bacterium]